MKKYLVVLILHFLCFNSHSLSDEKNTYLDVLVEEYLLAKAKFQQMRDDQPSTLIEKETYISDFKKSAQLLAISSEEEALALVLAGLLEYDHFFRYKPREIYKVMHPDEAEPGRDFWREFEKAKNHLVLINLNELEKKYKDLPDFNHVYINMLYSKLRIYYALNLNVTANDYKFPEFIIKDCDELMAMITLIHTDKTIKPNFNMDPLWRIPGNKELESVLLVEALLAKMKYYKDVYKKLEEEKIREGDEADFIQKSQDKILLEVYPLSRYPFLEDILDEQTQYFIQLQKDIQKMDAELKKEQGE